MKVDEGVPKRAVTSGPGSGGRSVDWADLMAAAAVGAPWAVDALAQEYLPRLSSFARHRGAADPDGIANVALSTVFRRLDQLDFVAPEQMWAYLCLTARSRIIDEQRRVKPVDLIGDAIDSADGPGSTDSGGAFDDEIVDQQYVSELLSPLTDEQRQVLQLRFLEDLSIEETARRTGRTRGAVKGLQRRAINAIVAAVAVILILVVIQAAGGDGPEVVDQSPADDTPATDTDTDTERGPDGADNRENGLDPLRPDVGTDGDADGDGGTVSADGSTETDSDADELDGAADESATGTDPATADADADSDADGLEPGSGGGRYVVTVGTDRTSTFVTSAPGSVSAHGTRVYCTVSHFAHDDPIAAPGRPGAAPARIFWGNTVAAASTTGAELGSTGNGTCEGGVVDRSAYWMPALFDADDQAVIPDHIRVEYKAFGGPGFERGSVQAIPSGLQMVVGPAVREASSSHTSVSVRGDQVTLVALFPSCVQVDGAGRPVLTGGPAAAHLSYPSGDEDGRSNCPASHPYRIPTTSFTLIYTVDAGRGWYLADDSADGGGAARNRSFTAGLVSAWDSSTMTTLVDCVREALRNCGFEDRSGGNAEGRGQLPERFLAPDGSPVYTNSVRLSDSADRTPFGTTLTPTPR